MHRQECLCHKTDLGGRQVFAVPSSPRDNTPPGATFVKNRAILSPVILLGLATSTLAADGPQPVRMGCGLMTFDTVPGWGLGADGKSVIGPCHGSVVVGKDGTIYTSANAGVFAFSP